MPWSTAVPVAVRTVLILLDGISISTSCMLRLDDVRLHALVTDFHESAIAGVTPYNPRFHVE